MADFATAIFEMEFDAAPNYKYLKFLLVKFMLDRDAFPNGRMDWSALRRRNRNVSNESNKDKNQFTDIEEHPQAGEPGDEDTGVHKIARHPARSNKSIKAMIFPEVVNRVTGISIRPSKFV